MRANLDRINVDLQRLRGGDTDRGEQRRSVMVALAQNNCGPQYRTRRARARRLLRSAVRPRERRTRGPAGDLANPVAQSGSVRTVCVRTCDGFYFPISYATSRRASREDEKTCQRMCPAAEVMLFSYRDRRRGHHAGDLGQRPALFVAAERVQVSHRVQSRCSCKRPGQSWADALGKDEAVEPGDIVVTEERAKQMSQPPAQKGQTKGRQPAAQPANAAPAADAGRAGDAAASRPRPDRNRAGKRTVRAVGPTFIAPATK